MKTYLNVDSYIAAYPEKTRSLLNQLRNLIKSAAPEAREKISYGIPTYEFEGNLVHFGGYKAHIGFYPGSKAIEKFAVDLVGYKTSKGTIQFPLEAPLPSYLVIKIVRYRLEHNLMKSNKRGRKIEA